MKGIRHYLILCSTVDDGTLHRNYPNCRFFSPYGSYLRAFSSGCHTLIAQTTFDWCKSKEKLEVTTLSSARRALQFIIKFTSCQRIPIKHYRKR